MNSEVYSCHLPDIQKLIVGRTKERMSHFPLWWILISMTAILLHSHLIRIHFLFLPIVWGWHFTSMGLAHNDPHLTSHHSTVTMVPVPKQGAQARFVSNNIHQKKLWHHFLNEEFEGCVDVHRAITDVRHECEKMKKSQSRWPFAMTQALWCIQGCPFLPLRKKDIPSLSIIGPHDSPVKSHEGSLSAPEENFRAFTLLIQDYLFLQSQEGC